MPTLPNHLSRPLFGLVSALLVIAAPAAKSESSAEARQWLSKMMAVYDHGPFTMDYAASLDLSQMGQPIRGGFDGKITYGDRHHLRMEMRLELTGLPGADGESSSPVQLEMLTVSDGEIMWTEIDMAEMGRQVMKISVEQAEELAASDSAGLAGNPASMDPVAQLEALADTLDFEVAAVSDDRVTLRGRVPAGGAEGLGTLGTLGVETFYLVVDAETGFPVEMRAGEPAPAIRMEFRNLRRLSRDALPPDVFVYRPPEGVAVTDLAAMLGGPAQ